MSPRGQGLGRHGCQDDDEEAEHDDLGQGVTRHSTSTNAQQYVIHGVIANNFQFHPARLADAYKAKRYSNEYLEGCRHFSQP